MLGLMIGLINWSNLFVKFVKLIGIYRSIGQISYSHQIPQVNLLVKFRKSMLQCLV